MSRLAVVVALFCCCFIAACGSHTLSGPPAQQSSQSLSSALAQLNALEQPPGLDAATWAQMRARLADALRASGQTKFVSAIPTAAKCQVSDFALTGDSGAATLTWTYRNVADYDQNGEVNVAELTTLGANLGKNSASADWPRARQADGDGNGEVNISDITPIGANFKNTVSGYKLQFSVDGSDGGTWTEVDDIATTVGTIPAGGGPRAFSVQEHGVAAGWYRVVPYAGAEKGAASNKVQLIAADPTPGVWPGPGGGAAQNNRGIIPGPALGTHVETAWFAEHLKGALVGTDDSMYSGGFDNYAYHLDKEGNLLWKVDLGGATTGMVLSPGNVFYLSAAPDYLVALNPDSSVEMQLHDAHHYKVAAWDAATPGLLCLAADGDLHKLNPQGQEQWHYDVPDYTAIEAVCSQGHIYCLEYQKMDPGNDQYYIHCLDETGAFQWQVLVRDGDDAPSISETHITAMPDGGVACAGFAMRVYDPNGSLRWAFDGLDGPWPGPPTPLPTANDMPRAPVVAANGDVFDGTAFEVSGNDRVFGWHGADGTNFLTDTHDGWTGSIAVNSIGRVIWNTYLGTGDPTLTSVIPGQPATYWSIYPSGRLFAPVSARSDGNFYGVTLGENACINQFNGDVLWHFGKSGSPSAPSFAADGTVYVQYWGLLALDGQLSRKWSLDANVMSGQYNNPPLVLGSGNIVLSIFGFGGTASPGQVLCCSPDGTELWHFDMQDHDYLLPGPCIEGSDGTIYFMADDAFTYRLYALDAGGNLKWSHDMAGSSTQGAAPALSTAGGHDSILVVENHDAVPESVVLGFDPDGNPNYTSAAAPDTDYSFGVHVGDDGSVYIRDDSHNIDCFDAAGAVHYSTPVAENPGDLAVQPDGSVVFCTYTPAQIETLKPDGSVKWAKALPSATTSRPILDSDGNAYFVDGSIYLSTDTVTVYSYDSAGTLRWSTPCAVDTHAGLVLGPGGKLYGIRADGSIGIVGDP